MHNELNRQLKTKGTNISIISFKYIPVVQFISIVMNQTRHIPRMGKTLVWVEKIIGEKKTVAPVGKRVL